MSIVQPYASYFRQSGERSYRNFFSFILVLLPMQPEQCCGAESRQGVIGGLGEGWGYSRLLFGFLILNRVAGTRLVGRESGGSLIRGLDG